MLLWCVPVRCPSGTFIELGSKLSLQAEQVGMFSPYIGLNSVLSLAGTCMGFRGSGVPILSHMACITLCLGLAGSVPFTTSSSAGI